MDCNVWSSFFERDASTFVFHRGMKRWLWTLKVKSAGKDSHSDIDAQFVQIQSKPLLTATPLQRPLFFVPDDTKSIHWLLFKTCVQQPPPYLSTVFQNPLQCISKHALIGRFHMTSLPPYGCTKTIKRRPCWCSKPILLVLNLFLM